MTQKEIDEAAAGPLWESSPRRSEAREITTGFWTGSKLAPGPIRSQAETDELNRQLHDAQIQSRPIGNVEFYRQQHAQQESWAAGMTHWKPSDLDYSKATFDKAEAEMRKIALDFATRAREPNPNVAIERAAAYLAFLRGEPKP